jgi:hypothetical protein
MLQILIFMTIAMTENSIYPGSLKSYYTPADFRAPISAVSSYKKPVIPSAFPVMKIKNDLFIVDWQLSDDGNTPAAGGEKLYV